METYLDYEIDPDLNEDGKVTQQEAENAKELDNAIEKKLEELKAKEYGLDKGYNSDLYAIDYNISPIDISNGNISPNESASLFEDPETARGWTDKAPLVDMANKVVDPNEEIPNEEIPDIFSDYEDPSKVATAKKLDKELYRKANNAVRKTAKNKVDEEGLTIDDLKGLPERKGLKGLWDKYNENSSYNKTKKKLLKEIQEADEYLQDEMFNTAEKEKEADQEAQKQRVNEYFKPLQYERKVYSNGKQKILPKGTFISPDGTSFYNPETKQIENMSYDDTEEENNKAVEKPAGYIKSAVGDAVNEKVGNDLWSTIIKGV